MKKHHFIFFLLASLSSASLLTACGSENQQAAIPLEADSPPAPIASSIEQSSANIQNHQRLAPFWQNATVYFMLLDRFANGDPSNDFSYGRKQDAALLRDFKGGDFKGVINKIEQNYFTDLGVNALWMTPVYEQIHGVDEDYLKTYAYHGYWIKDWTTTDANFGSEDELKKLIEVAHKKGIRVLMDVVINHTGPATTQDDKWPEAWVRSMPTCNWQGYDGNVNCTLAASLPDIKTESEQPVKLPKHLLEKWQREGRLTSELAELDEFFARTGYPRAPKYYLIKWLTDWVREYGIDGFRVDTAKHVDASVWLLLKTQAQIAFTQWRTAHPKDAFSEKNFFMVGEVMNFGVDNFKNAKGRFYDFGDKQVDFFAQGMDSLINMGFAQHVSKDADSLFTQYSHALHQGELQGVGVLNYLASHDDMEPYDPKHQHSFNKATKLMLTSGAVQIYYGDELARPLSVDDINGDATLRSFMNWQDLQDKASTQALLKHWQKLGKFRHDHMAVGVGIHQKLQQSPYMFKRTLSFADDQSKNGERVLDKVLVALNFSTVNTEEITLPTHDVFAEGSIVQDYYSKQKMRVVNGKLTFKTPYTLALLALAQ